MRTAWDADAACIDADPESFFELENAAESARMPDYSMIAGALACCARCPLIAPCLVAGSGSLGVWGGLTAAQRGLSPYRPIMEEVPLWTEPLSAAL